MNTRSSNELSAVAGSPNLVQPPESLIPFRLQPGEDPRAWILYEQHPAYSSLIRSATLRGRMAALITFSRYFVLVLVKRWLRYELIPPALRRPRNIAGVWRLLRHLADRGRPQSRGNLQLFAPTGREIALGNALLSQGCAVFVAPDQEVRVIQDASAHLFEELRSCRGKKEGARQFIESRMRASEITDARLYEAIDACLRHSGVFAAVGTYLKREVKLIEISPQINDPSDDFWRRVFPDGECSMPQTAYLHKDASGGDIKVMIYLSDVGITNGPFSFVLNSHVAKRQGGDLVEETNDHAGLSGTDRVTRQRFASLPSRLRRKCAYGNDIEDSSPLSGRLLSGEWKITGRKGTIVIFDPKGFHRGGMVEEGERVVITCVIG